MLIKKGSSWVVGDNYEIKGKEEYAFEYFEGDKYLLVSWEGIMPNDEFKMLIYTDSMEEWTIPKGEKISEEKRVEIIRNCKEGWNFLQTPVEFVEFANREHF